MKIVLPILVVLVIAMVAYFFVLGQKSKAATPPGLVSGKLAECSNTPNCVCTEYPRDAAHFVEPFEMKVTADTASLVENAVQSMGGELVAREDNYLAFTFTSALFGFVDDFEIRFDPAANLLHIRSASRVGHSDMGVNKKRVETFKAVLSGSSSQREH